MKWTLLEAVCDLVAPPVLIYTHNMIKTNFSAYILVIQNIFDLLNSSSIRKLGMKTVKIPSFVELCKLFSMHFR